MISIEKALELGATIFDQDVDERHFCRDCQFAKKNPWKGRCSAGVVQYLEILNHCLKFKKMNNPYNQNNMDNQEDRFWE